MAGEFSRVSTHYYPEFKAQTLIVNGAALRVAWFAVKPFISKAFVATTQLCRSTRRAAPSRRTCRGASAASGGAAAGHRRQGARRSRSRALLANFFTKLIGPSARPRYYSFAEVEYAV